MSPTASRHGRLPLKRAVRKLREKALFYRRLAVFAAFFVFALSAALAYTALDAPSETAVLIGEGQAGLITAAAVTERPELSDPLAAGDVEGEQESLPPPPAPAGPGAAAGEGPASFYGSEFAGSRTASGERFDPGQLTAAHRSLPLGSRVRVTNTRNGRSVVVRINDRGPFHGNRIIDVSHAAARELGFVQRGTAPVRLELISRRG
jgi:rare lipoprotein A